MVNNTRYQRQEILSFWAKLGQERIFSATVFIAGCGGLGNVVASYLALAGIGKLILVDNDKIEITNLNRQFLYNEFDIGKEKAKIIAQRIKKLNPAVGVKWHNLALEELTEENFSGVNVFIDALDSIKAKLYLNQKAFEYKIPLIHACVEAMELRLTTIIPNETPCLCCLYDDKLDENKITPIVGAICPVAGGLQSLEAIKIILNYGNLMKNKLFIFDLLTWKLLTAQYNKKVDCQVCSGLT